MTRAWGGATVRLAALAALLGAEALVTTILVDGATPVPRGAWLTLFVHQWGARVARGLIAFSVLFATFAYVRFPGAWARIWAEAAKVPVRWVLLGAHAALMALFALLTAGVYGTGLTAALSNWCTAAWIGIAVAAVACGALACLPWTCWESLVRGTGWLWAWSAAAAVAAGSGDAFFRSLWQPTSKVTFSLVSLMLRPFFGDIVADTNAMRIGTQRFHVIITRQCSGLEGIALLLVFGVIFLIVFRDELRMPRALAILPAGVVILYLLNAVRITALIAIGNAGAEAIAVGGFHSQAGWLAFNSVAFGLCLAARHVPWIAATPNRAQPQAYAESDGTAAYLVPFLSILAVGMISRAASGAFEWLYPLRLVAAGWALWAFRKHYAGLDWRPGWVAVAAGVVVAGLWVALDLVAGSNHGDSPMPAALAAAPAGLRLGWIAFRAAGAAITVPIAEELAFRGYLMRRVISTDFEAVPLRTFNWPAVVASSVIFGLMHGDRWPAGIVAGLIFTLVITRRGRIGDAVIAHAVSNVILTALVLGFSQWRYW